jgi:hypothetical protein
MYHLPKQTMFIGMVGCSKSNKNTSLCCIECWLLVCLPVQFFGKEKLTEHGKSGSYKHKSVIRSDNSEPENWWLEVYKAEIGQKKRKKQLGISNPEG